MNEIDTFIVIHVMKPTSRIDLLYGNDNEYLIEKGYIY